MLDRLRVRRVGDQLERCADAAQKAIADLNGNYKVEGEGVSPDIEVDNDVFSTIHGKDPQLDRGIAEVMARIKAHPLVLPTRQAEPVKAPADMRAKP